MRFDWACECCKVTQTVIFIVSLSAVDLLHRNPTTAGIFYDICHAQGQHKREILQHGRRTYVLEWKKCQTYCRSGVTGLLIELLNVTYIQIALLHEKEKNDLTKFTFFSVRVCVSTFLTFLKIFNELFYKIMPLRNIILI